MNLLEQVDSLLDGRPRSVVLRRAIEKYIEDNKPSTYKAVWVVGGDQFFTNCPKNKILEYLPDNSFLVSMGPDEFDPFDGAVFDVDPFGANPGKLVVWKEE